MAGVVMNIKINSVAKVILVFAIAASWGCGRSGEHAGDSAISNEIKGVSSEAGRQADYVDQGNDQKNRNRRESYSHSISSCHGGLMVNGEKLSGEVLEGLKNRFVTFGDAVPEEKIHRSDGFYYAFVSRGMGNSKPSLACSSDLILLAAWVCNEESYFHGNECVIRRTGDEWVPMDSSGACLMTDIKVGLPLSFCKKRGY